MQFPRRHKHAPANLPTKDQPADHKIQYDSNREKRKDSGTTPSMPKPLSPTHPPRVPSQRTQNNTRPALSRRRTTARTRYVDMLLGLDEVSPLHNILASLSVWILLAGYIVFPATFTKLQDRRMEDKADTDLKATALRTVRYVPSNPSSEEH
mgnify:CR=1 FL=1